MQQTTSEAVVPALPRFGVDLKSTDVCYRQALWGVAPAQEAPKTVAEVRAQPATAQQTA